MSGQPQPSYQGNISDLDLRLSAIEEILKGCAGYSVLNAIQMAIRHNGEIDGLKCSVNLLKSASCDMIAESIVAGYAQTIPKGHVCECSNFITPWNNPTGRCKACEKLAKPSETPDSSNPSMASNSCEQPPPVPPVPPLPSHPRFHDFVGEDGERRYQFQLGRENRGYDTYERWFPICELLPDDLENCCGLAASVVRDLANEVCPAGYSGYGWANAWSQYLAARQGQLQ